MSHIEVGDFYLFFNGKVRDPERRWAVIRKTDYGLQRRAQFFSDKKAAIDFAKQNTKKRPKKFYQPPAECGQP